MTSSSKAAPCATAAHQAQTSVARAIFSLLAAEVLLPHLERSKALDASALRTHAYGGNDAQGAWEWKAAS